MTNPFGLVWRKLRKLAKRKGFVVASMKNVPNICGNPTGGKIIIELLWGEEAEGYRRRD